MRSRLRLVMVLLAGFSGWSAPLAAQVAGLPVRNAGIGTGLGIAADVGFPNSGLGKGVAYGATGVIGLGPLGLSASIARHDPSGSADAITSVGGTGNLKVFGGPLIPFAITLQGGVGHYRQDTIEGGRVTTWRLPAGLGIALTIPNPAFSIKPWVAPRLDLTHTRESGGSGSGTATHTEGHFGISGGVDLGFLGGLSVRAMYDRVQAGNGPNPSVLSLGLGFRVGT